MEGGGGEDRVHLRRIGGGWRGGIQSFFSLSALLSQVEVCWIIGRDYPATLTFSLSLPPPALPSVHLIEMLHSCADSAYPDRASTLRNLGSVTPWDGSDAASNTYFYVIRNNFHRTVLVGNTKNVTKFCSLVLNATFEVRKVALLKMKILRHVGRLDPKYDG